MTKPFKQWKVLPHGKLKQIDDNILTVTGDIHMPLMDLPRRMTVVRLNGSRLAVFSAIALDDDEMAELEAYLVAHGSPIEDNPRQVLRDLAGSLA